MLSVQEYIKKNFSKFRKSTTEVMDISNKNLEGELNLEGFNKLKVLNCSANSLTKLNVSDCPRLTKIFCSNNQLTSVDFLKQLKHPERLVSLDIGDNDFLSLEDDLSFFDPFVNLKKFYLNNDAADWKKVQESLSDYLKIKKGKYYYDIYSWRKDQSSLSGTTSPTSSVRIDTSTNFLLRPFSKLRTSDFSAHEPTVVDWEPKNQELKSWLLELNNIVFPENFRDDFDLSSFTELRDEVKKLKIRELELRWREKKSQLEQLVGVVREKIGISLEKILEIYLEDCTTMIEQEKESDSFFQGRLDAYQNVLQTQVREEELLDLSQNQKEVIFLERQLVNLGWQEQDFQTNIQIPPKSD